MSSVIIEVKNSQGKRTTVSINAQLFEYQVARFDGDLKAARKDIKKIVKLGDNGLSELAEMWIFKNICKQEILEKREELFPIIT
ncbi:MAG: hypothetical protein HRU20_29685 [Pseudomonadales bacterium]|nr:hypothetical protein [Pseudomonadales bacterium]